MKAEIAAGYDRDRQKLADIVPLQAPFTLFVTPAQVCNLKCGYCTQSLSLARKKELGFKQQLQDWEVFARIAHQAAEFPVRMKRVLLTGLGEPLMNKRLPEMISTLARLNVAEKYEVFTNATLLIPEVSERLLESGLTGLRISIQGTTSERYREVAGADVRFEDVVENIRHFYAHRGTCRVYVKIIDDCLQGEADRERFFSAFGDICDQIYVEHLVKAQPSMMGDYGDRADNDLTFYGEHSVNREVCPYIFYTLQTDAVGHVFPCPPLGFPVSFSLGNIFETTLKEIWNGERLRALRMAHLDLQRRHLPICGTCVNYLCFTPDADNLDDRTEDIKARLEVEGRV